MFYILIIFGISLIILGLFNDNKKGLETNDNPSNIEELKGLEFRIENLENMLFYFGEKDEDKPTNSLETYKLLSKYEKENHTLEEICALLGLNKGELLLLKNLYKDY